MNDNAPDEQKHSDQTADEADSDIIIAGDDAEIITDGGEEIQYFDDRDPVTIFGHAVRQVLEEDGQPAYECQTCDLVSNTVTAFDQHGCEEAEGP
ncbi:MAG: hypothetical protein ABEI57_03845 [Halapricum sp.]